ncbi:MAG: DUF4743 domain-containing protein [Wohlfahrtiimonas sp.]
MNYQHLFDALPAPNLSNYTPLSFQGQKIGYVNKKHIPVLAQFSKIFQFTFANLAGMFAQEFVEMNVEDRSHALLEVSQTLRDSGLVHNWRDELFSIYLDADRQTEIFQLERGVVPLLALQAHGVHLNGYTMIDDVPHIWIAQRSADRVIAPLKYDQLVAGGLPAELSLKDNLYKEAGEEAGIAKDLVEPAQYKGSIQYMTEDEFGIRNDVLHCFDVELPESFKPHNQDGEVEKFMRLPVFEVIALLQQQDLFKPNTALVMLNFLLRQDWLDVDTDEKAQLMSYFKPAI